MKLKRGWDEEGGAVQSRIESLTKESALTDDSPFTSFMLCYVSVFNVYQMNCQASGNDEGRGAHPLSVLCRKEIQKIPFQIQYKYNI